MFELAGEGAASTDAPRKLLLRQGQALGDVVVLTAAVRDLHKAQPGKFVTDVRTSCGAVWENNPYITKIEDEEEPEEIDCHYPLINNAHLPHHFITGFHDFLSAKLGVEVPITEFRGDLHLSGDEMRWMSQVEETGYRGRYWVVMGGGKKDFTTKWWPHSYYQAVVDHFRGKIQFVQAGVTTHHHQLLKGVIDLRDKTDIRQFIRLIYHADGVLCPITGAMHVAAALPKKDGQVRACVVVAGGREQANWERYPWHRYLDNVGTMPCCLERACWKNRCQPINDGDPKDEARCPYPVMIDHGVLTPRCMAQIRPEDAIRAIESYYDGGALTYG